MLHRHGLWSIPVLFEPMTSRVVVRRPLCLRSWAATEVKYLLLYFGYQLMRRPT